MKKRGAARSRSPDGGGGCGCMPAVIRAVGAMPEGVHACDVVRVLEALLPKPPSTFAPGVATGACIHAAAEVAAELLRMALAGAPQQYNCLFGAVMATQLAADWRAAMEWEAEGRPLPDHGAQSRASLAWRRVQEAACARSLPMRGAGLSP